MNKTKKVSVTIGIPAYNEENNLKLLLKDISDQNLIGIKIDKVIVYSDGSTDNTTELKKSIGFPLKIIHQSNRRGQAYAQNMIIKETNSDILVLFNADIRIKDKNFIDKLIFPIAESNVDLVSCRVQPSNPKNYFEKVLHTRVILKQHIFENWKGGNNIYTCHGRVRALSSRLYKKLNFKFSLAEDAYSYLFCLKNNFNYKYVKNCSINYKLPANFQDHFKQSIRFFQAENVLRDEFDREFIRSQYKLPFLNSIKSLISMFLKHPLIMFLYICITTITKLSSNIITIQKNTWDVALSSKKV